MLDATLTLRNRRAVLDGLVRLLDAAGLEELFAGPDEEAAFLYDLLEEAVRGRSASIYWEICRTARRRRVTPDYVVDRAAVLSAAMAERRRADLYRILGVPPLASSEVLRQRWLDVAKREHPDAGGDGVRFRHVKAAYEVLRDPAQRVEYERFWLRALGPFERVAPAEHRQPIEGVRKVVSIAPERRAVEVREEPPAAPAAESPARDARALVHAAARLLAARDSVDRRLGGAGALGLGGVLGRLEDALAAVHREELDALRENVDRAVVVLEGLQHDFARLAALKALLAPDPRPVAAPFTARMVAPLAMEHGEA